MPDEYEQKKLSDTRSFIAERIKLLSSEIEKGREKVRERNRDFLAENPFGSVYGAADEIVRKNESELQKAENNRREIDVLSKMEKEPYFGRVDFFYDDENDEEKIYIGLKNLMDRHNILVYDWRAPISSLFYMGELGRASYTAPSGEISGEIRLLRQYSFNDKGEVNCWDSELHIDDDVLKRVLSGASAEKMRSIVCTIQREQNAAIRFSSKENLAVFGPAGCGKTSVGMHRLAWLMYRAHTEGYAVSTLMCSSNAAFRSYLSGVLPELGEVNTSFFSFTELFSRYLDSYNIESALSQTENVISGKAARIKNIELLYSPGFTEFIEKKLTELSGGFKTVTVLGEIALEKEVLEKKFKTVSRNSSVKQRLEILAEWVSDELQNYLLINRKNILSYLLEHIEPGESYTESYTRLKKQVLEKSRQMVLSAVPSDPAALLIRFLREYYGETPDVHAVIMRLGRRDVYFEEAVTLLFISACLGNCPAYLSPTHVLIDEAQDMCAMQHKTIRLLFPKSVFTVLAAVNQGIAPEVNTLSPDDISEIYRAKSIVLTKSYRSTTGISGFSKRFLPKTAPDYETFSRDGKPVEITETEDPISTLVSDLQLIDSENRAITEKALVMPAALTKGLEFDRVIVPVNTNAPVSDRIMYLSSTRALHELYVLNYK